MTASSGHSGHCRPSLGPAAPPLVNSRGDLSMNLGGNPPPTWPWKRKDTPKNWKTAWGGEGTYTHWVNPHEGHSPQTTSCNLSPYFSRRAACQKRSNFSCHDAGALPTQAPHSGLDQDLASSTRVVVIGPCNRSAACFADCLWLHSGTPSPVWRWQWLRAVEQKPVMGGSGSLSTDCRRISWSHSPTLFWLTTFSSSVSRRALIQVSLSAMVSCAKSALARVPTAAARWRPATQWIRIDSPA